LRKKRQANRSAPGSPAPVREEAYLAILILDRNAPHAQALPGPDLAPTPIMIP